VIVWLHTGAFFGGSANLAFHNPQRLVLETGAIVVMPNYRHGPFGFLAHGALTAEDPLHPASGNYGLMDQRAALEWVRDNIAQFGGDPQNVTLAGTSAGGESVGLQLVSPARGHLGSCPRMYRVRRSRVHEVKDARAGHAGAFAGDAASLGATGDCLLVANC
jgi:carboxylesterase type B